jgi:hypothetical protein
MRTHKRLHALAALLASALLSTQGTQARDASQSQSPEQPRPQASASRPDSAEARGWQGRPLEELRREREREPRSALTNYNLGAAL